MALIPPQPIGVLPGSGLWNDWIEKIRTIVNSLLISLSWSTITGTPTTLAGYGITDAQSKLNNSAGLAGALSDETGTGVAVFNNTPTLITPALGAATGTSLVLTGGITTGTGTLHTSSVNLTDGAAAAAGTLLNAPAIGNPTKWLAINDNGTTRYIPAW